MSVTTTKAETTAPAVPSWLESLCCPNSTYDVLRHPWKLTAPRGGLVATDGRVLVWLCEEPDGCPPYPALVGADLDKVLSVLDKPAEPVGSIDLQALCAWCGPYQKTESVVCPHCDGSFFLPAARRPGCLGPVLIDRNQLAQAVERLEGDLCRVGVWRDGDRNSRVCVERPGAWVVWLMGVFGPADGTAVAESPEMKEKP